MPEHPDKMGDQPALSDAQWMQLMAWVDGELEGDAQALAEVRALLDSSHEARAVVHDLRLSAQTLQRDVLQPQRAPWAAEELSDDALDAALSGLRDRVMADTEAMTIMAWNDGELANDPVAAADVQTLLAGSEAARNLARDLRLAREALRAQVMDAEVEADLSMVRGRILTRLPLPEREPQRDTRPGFGEGLLQWLRSALSGRAGLAAGLAAAAVLLAVALSQVQDQVASRGPSDGGNVPVVAQQLDPEPAVIIEEMEIDSGTVMVDKGLEEDAPTIIWHILDEDEGAG